MQTKENARLSATLCLHLDRKTEGFRHDRPPPAHCLDQQRKLRRRQHYATLDQRGPHEAMSFQALGEQAHTRTVSVQRLEIVAAPATEQEDMPAIGLDREQRTHRRRKTVEPQTNADRLACEIDLRARRQ